MKIFAAHLCENAFQDKRNRWNLIGVFTGDLVVKELPAHISLALYVEVSLEQPADIEMAFYIGRKMFAEGKGMTLGDVAGKTVGILAVPQISIGVDRPTDFRIAISHGGGPKKTLLRKKIVLSNAPADGPDSD